MIQPSGNFVRMFIFIEARPEIKMGHVGSKIRSLGQFLEQEFSQRLCCTWEEHLSVTYIIATVTANEFLIFTHCLMILYICTKICENTCTSKFSELLSKNNLHTEIYQGGIIT